VLFSFVLFGGVQLQTFLPFTHKHVSDFLAVHPIGRRRLLTVGSPGPAPVVNVIFPLAEVRAPAVVPGALAAELPVHPVAIVAEEVVLATG